MKRPSFSDTTRIAAETWIWYTLKGYYGDVEYMRSLQKFQLVIGHHESTTIPTCPLLANYHHNISDKNVNGDWKLYIIDLFL